jgi:hypothetical protein
MPSKKWPTFQRADETPIEPENSVAENDQDEEKEKSSQEKEDEKSEEKPISRK